MNKIKLTELDDLLDYRPYMLMRLTDKNSFGNKELLLKIEELLARLNE